MGAATSPLKDRMIFLVGARRSGTNWLQRIITAHPTVMGVRSESALFTHGIQPLMERFHHGAIGSPRMASIYVPRDELIDAIRNFCDAVFLADRDAVAPGADRIAERTPDHVRCLGLMGEIYPDARFVHIIRDGRDVARSLRDQAWGPDTLSEAAEEWRTAIEAARRDAPNLVHYREVRYEELFANTRAVVTELFDWLELSHSEELLDEAVGEAAAPFNVDAIDARIATQKWKVNLSPQDQHDFNRVAGATLRGLGYEQPGSVSEETDRRFAPVRRRQRRLGRDAWHRRETRSHLQRTQVVADRFLDVFGSRRFDELDSLFRPDVAILVRGAAGWQGRGREAVDRFRREIAGDPAFGVRQTAGHVHTGPGISFILASYRGDDGSSHDRAFVLWASGELIERVVFYTLPLSRG